MVVYDFIEENDTQIIYWYYPEDDRTQDYGIIEVDKIKEKIRITKGAEGDFANNNYGHHAIHQIIERLNNDEKPRGGMVMWY
ncbi:MAG: hypothetical protein IKS56_00935 [Lachnospiraceae bacterium]|nr:hypothetical protein [Lachnospiraceae bacterium]